MNFALDERPSDSPFVERIWQARSEHGGPFRSIAMSHWEMVVTRLNGRTTVTVRGPETKATSLYCPADGTWLGIRFRLGTIMPQLPARALVDAATDLPEMGRHAFWLQGSAWEVPDFDNAEAFVNRLVRDGLLVQAPVVDAALHGEPNERSPRTAQRHFVRTTGLTHGAVRRIERARYATTLLQQGVPILDSVHEAGYFDQPHLTRSLKHFIGQTPAQIMGRSKAEPLSLLY
ncbi:MAG: helix-turn-helix domain-containing protein, partial [Dehalococcoidia bacterium]